MKDGKSIFSGWHDGKIRAFLPQSGKLLFCINDAHTNGVTALTSTHDSQRIISGGMNGEIRVWKINRQSQVMEASLKEHRSRVWSIQVNSLNDRAISASADGSCIVWDIKAFTRLACMFETTMFKQLVYHPDESQILTTGTDRKITYWDIVEAVELRMMDGSLDGEVNSLSISRSGEFFVSAINFDWGLSLRRSILKMPPCIEAFVFRAVANYIEESQHAHAEWREFEEGY